MAAPMTPGIYFKEVATGPRPIGAVGTTTAGFLGVTPNAKAHKNEPVACNNWSEFLREFCNESSRSTDLSTAVYGFFMNGGGRCYVLNLGDSKAPLAGDPQKRTGLAALEPIDEIAMVVAPGYSSPASYSDLVSHCERLEDRVALIDAPVTDNIDQLKVVATADAPAAGDAGADSGDSGTTSTRRGAGARPANSDGGFAAFYFPNISLRDPLGSGEIITAPPSGHIAGIYARTDTNRGVHKAPANEVIRGALGLAYQVSREEQGELNRAGVNCIRYFADGGIRVWGARTIAPEASEWRYISIRRLFNMVKESIAEGTKWTVFEPNDELLWGAVKRDVGAFLTTLWRDGALFGTSPGEAFFVKCDAENNPPESRDQGQLIVDVGIAPVKPAEFVTFRIGQWSGAGSSASEEQN